MFPSESLFPDHSTPVFFFTVQTVGFSKTDCLEGKKDLPDSRFSAPESRFLEPGLPDRRFLKENNNNLAYICIVHFDNLERKNHEEIPLKFYISEQFSPAAQQFMSKEVPLRHELSKDFLN